MRGSRLCRFALSAAVAAMVGPAVAGAAEGSGCGGAERSATVASVAATRAALVCLIDAARAERGLAALKVNGRLQTAAQRYVRTLDPAKPLTHSGRNGSTPLTRIADAGYARDAGGFTAAETLGRSKGSLSTPAARVKAWLASAATRRLLLSARYRDVGIGVAVAGEVATFVVEVATPTTTARGS